MTYIRETRQEMETRLKKWATELTEEQARTLLIEMVEFAIDADAVHFWHDSLAPSWEGNGGSLVEGQKTFPDDDEI